MKKINKFIIFLTWIISLIFLFNTPIRYNEQFIYYVFINTFLSTVVFLLLYNIRSKSNYFSICILFMIGYIIVHFQIPIMTLFNNSIQVQYFEDFFWSDINVACKSIAIASAGLSSFFMGYVFRKQKPPTKFNLYYVSNNKYQIGIYIAYTFYILFFVTAGSYSYGIYDSASASKISNYFISFFNVSCQFLIIYKTYTTVIKNNSIISYLRNFDVKLILLVFWHIFFSIFTGDRGPVIVYVILLFSPYFFSQIKSFSFIKISLIIIFLPMFFNILGSARIGETSKNSFSERVIQADQSRYHKFFKNSDFQLGSSSMELALSGRCLNHAIYNVPKNYPYFYGIQHFSLLLSAVPFLNGFFQKNYNDNEQKYNGSANFITYLIQGNNPTYGDGTSCTTDVYLDFGLFGIIVIFLLFGYYTNFLDLVLLNSKNKHFFHWIAAMIFLSGAIYISRGSIGLYFQRIIQIYIFFYLIKSNKRIVKNST